MAITHVRVVKDADVGGCPVLACASLYPYTTLVDLVGYTFLHYLGS